MCHTKKVKTFIETIFPDLLGHSWLKTIGKENGQNHDNLIVYHKNQQKKCKRIPMGNDNSLLQLVNALQVFCEKVKEPFSICEGEFQSWKCSQQETLKMPLWQSFSKVLIPHVALLGLIKEPCAPVLLDSLAKSLRK